LICILVRSCSIAVFTFLVNTLNKASAIGSFLHSRVAKERLSFRLGRADKPVYFIVFYSLPQAKYRTAFCSTGSALLVQHIGAE
jgi:hypothetical protein